MFKTPASGGLDIQTVKARAGRRRINVQNIGCRTAFKIFMLTLGFKILTPTPGLRQIRAQSRPTQTNRQQRHKSKQQGFKIFILTPGDTREASRTPTTQLDTREAFKIFILTPGRHKRSITHSFTGITLAYAIMCCCPLGGSIPGAPNRASGEALGVGGRRRSAQAG